MAKFTVEILVPIQIMLDPSIFAMALLGFIGKLFSQNQKVKVTVR
jgi:hypothetical protein